MTPPPGQVLRSFLERRTGFAIPEDRWEWLVGGFLERLRGRGFANDTDYVAYLEEDPRGAAELEALFNALTVRKTSFFRNPACFQALEQAVLPAALARRTTQRPVSIWSAGCSTGEEAYSLAMVASQVLGDVPFYVLGTDIAPEALIRARQGSYPARAADPIPDRFQRHLTVVGGRTWIREELRAATEFASHNLAIDLVPRAAAGRWDVIACRNVLIYFGLEQARAVLRRFADALVPGGALFLGHAEVFTDAEPEFEVVFHGQTFYYRRTEHGAPPVVPQLARYGPDHDTRPDRRRPADPAAATKPAAPRPQPSAAAPPPGAPQTRPAATRPSDSGSTGSGSGEVAPIPPRVPRRGARFDQAPTDRWSPRRVPGDTPTRAGTRRIVSETPDGFVSEETRSEAERIRDGRPFEALLDASGRRQRGDLDGAVQLLREAIRQAPRWARPRVQLAEVFREQGRVEQAIRQLEAAVEVEPLEPRAHYLLGVIRAEQDGYSSAEIAFRRALYLEPDYVWARYALARTYRATGRVQRARRELRNVLRTLRTVELGRRQAGNPADASLADLVRMCESELAELEAED